MARRGPGAAAARGAPSRMPAAAGPARAGLIARRGWLAAFDPPKDVVVGALPEAVGGTVLTDKLRAAPAGW
jgi:hypothetical protein